MDKFRKKGFNFRKFEMEMMLKAREMKSLVDGNNKRLKEK
jgi:hypothetical protein